MMEREAQRIPTRCKGASLSALTLIQNDNDNLTSDNWHTGVTKLDEEHLIILIPSHSILKNPDINTASVGAIDPEQERDLHSQIVNVSYKRETEMNSKVVIFCGNVCKPEIKAVVR